MLNREELFAAIGEIDDELVLPVLERLEGERERPHLRVTRKAIRVALIAAVIAALPVSYTHLTLPTICSV